MVVRIFSGTRVVHVDDITVKLASLKEQIEQLLHHPYLREHLPAPAIDEDRLLLSLSMLDGASTAPSEAERCIIAMMLMQIALDTHDEVTDDGGDLRARQLVVLAGDLYSGLYYELLARSGETALIRSFAEAVRDINEQKVRLYEKSRADRVVVCGGRHDRIGVACQARRPHGGAAVGAVCLFVFADAASAARAGSVHPHGSFGAL